MKPIYVTKPSLPPLNEFKEVLKEIWNSEYITNSGPFHEKLEEELADYLGVKYISLFSNGTLALITALQALDVKGEVITTPYSFVATTNSLIWNGITPVFADINSDDCNININEIEAKITAKTTSIMPVHVYGKPCDVDGIKKLADKYKLKIIYDAAHAFGVKYKEQSVLNYGDLSILSFHATKVFNTIEGGAIISHTKEMKTKIDNLKNFGIVNETTVVYPGINAKMNELQAAYGLLNLKYIEIEIEKRKQIYNYYVKSLKDIKGIIIYDVTNVSGYNYGYFPIFVNEQYPFSRDELFNILKRNNIYTRRYFYPLISDFPIYSSIASASRTNLPNAVIATETVLCLPMYANLDEETISFIAHVIKKTNK
jgi:dTDP-4-amino-4,6-dideoxygalactose transaminase